MAVWLRVVLAAALTFPLTLLAGLIVGIAARWIPRWGIGDLLNIPTLVLIATSLGAAAYTLSVKQHLWASVFALTFTTLLAQLIPFFSNAVMFIEKPQVGERFRNAQFAVWLAAGFYFAYTVLGFAGK